MRWPMSHAAAFSTEPRWSPRDCCSTQAASAMVGEDDVQMEFLLMGREVRRIPPRGQDHAHGCRNQVERQIHWHPPLVRPDVARLRELAAVFLKQKNTREHNSPPTHPPGSCTVVKFGMPPSTKTEKRCQHAIGVACRRGISAMALLQLINNPGLIVRWLCAQFVTNSWISV